MSANTRMRTIKLTVIIQQKLGPVLVEKFNIEHSDIFTYLDVRNLIINKLSEEKQKTNMPWGNLRYRTTQLSSRGRVFGGARGPLSLEDKVVSNVVPVTAKMKLTKKERNREINEEKREIEERNKILKLATCKDLKEMKIMRTEQHKQNMKMTQKKLKKKLAKKGLTFDASVYAEGREKGLKIIQVSLKLKIRQV